MSETMYDRIKRLRIEKEMSQEELALKCGYTSRSTINKIEKGERNTTLLDWINDEIKTLGEEQFFHADYEATLVDTYGSDYEESLVVEGGVTE